MNAAGLSKWGIGPGVNIRTHENTAPRIKTYVLARALAFVLLLSVENEIPSYAFYQKSCRNLDLKPNGYVGGC